MDVIYFEDILHYIESPSLCILSRRSWVKLDSLQSKVFVRLEVMVIFSQPPDNIEPHAKHCQKIPQQGSDRLKLYIINVYIFNGKI